LRHLFDYPSPPGSDGRNESTLPRLCGPTGLLLGSIESLLVREKLPRVPVFWFVSGAARNCGLLRAIGGAGFAIALMIAERRARSIHKRSAPRIAFWGVLASASALLAYSPFSAALNVGTRCILQLMPTCACLMAVSAAWSLASAGRTAPLLASSEQSLALEDPEG
jgi:hypothetical protein